MLLINIIGWYPSYWNWIKININLYLVLGLEIEKDNPNPPHKKKENRFQCSKIKIITLVDYKK